MSLKVLKFAIFFCLLAGFSPVRGDDKNVAEASKDVLFRKQTRPRGCSCNNSCNCNKGCNSNKGCGCNKGCTYNGIFIPEGETRTVAPCQYGSCSGGKVVIAMADCAPLSPGCRYESTMTECCKKICDLGCTYNGIFIAEGETEPVAPCEWGTCENGEVILMVADCEPLEAGCRYESTMAECCKQICDLGCTYNGIFIPEGEDRLVEPCKYGYCNGGKVDIFVQDCARPQPNCRYEPTLENCCNLVCDPCGPIDELVDIAPAPSK